jgi:hypothetical protein
MPWRFFIGFMFEATSESLQTWKLSGLTMPWPGRSMGTSAAAICRLENADYEGHSLAMLNRIAEAMNSRVEIRFVSMRPRSKRPVLA